MFNNGKKTIYIIDGYGFIFRAYYAVPNFVTANKEPIGAVFGFFKMLISLINSTKPSHMVVALDTGKKTFRNTIYDEFLERKSLKEMFKNNEYSDFFKKVNLSFEEAEKMNSNDIINKLSISRDKINNICDKYNMDSLNPPKMLVLLIFLNLIDKINVEDYKTQYKANRRATPKELIGQFKIIRELIDAIGIASKSVIGYEADDVIASIAREAVQNNYNAIVVSADKDLCQLVKDNEIAVYDPMKKHFLDEAGVLKKFGVKSNQIVDYLSIIGDHSDNVYGVNGIGPKGAIKLLEKYGSVEEILSHLDEIDKKSSDKFRASMDVLELAKKLITLKYDALKIDDFDTFKVNINHQTLSEFTNKYNFKKIDKSQRHGHFSAKSHHADGHCLLNCNNTACSGDGDSTNNTTHINNNERNITYSNNDNYTKYSNEKKEHKKKRIQEKQNAKELF